MKYPLLYLLLALLITASCSSREEKILKLERQMAESPTVDRSRKLVALYEDELENPEGSEKRFVTAPVQPLIQAYVRHANAFPSDMQYTPEYLYKAAQLQLDSKMYIPARNNFMRIVSTYPESDYAPRSLYRVAQMTKDRFGDMEGATLFYQTLIEGYPESEYTDSARTVADGNETLEALMLDYGDRLYLDTARTMINREMARRLTDAMEMYVVAHPDAPNADRQLYAAFEMSQSFNDPQRSLQLLNKLLRRYPESQETATALFMKAFLYEERLDNLDSARVTYETYLARFPDHALTESARFNLKNIGRSKEEVLDELIRNRTEQ